MKPLSSFLMLAATLLTFVSAPLHASSDDSRPRLDQFSSYDAFMQAMASWEARPISRPMTASTPAATPTANAPTTRPIPLPEGMDPASEKAPPPLAITGPEDLETAVELAKDISHPNYTARIRYNRTTHLSFPLQSIDGSDMSQTSIENSLAGNAMPENEAAAASIDSGLKTPNTLNPGEPDTGIAPGIYAGVTLQQPTHITIETTY
jgi:hypothetical protein